MHVKHVNVGRRALRRPARSSDKTRSTTRPQWQGRLSIVVVVILLSAFSPFGFRRAHGDDQLSVSRLWYPGLQFDVPTIDGSRFQFPPETGEWTVVCFLGTECPLARLYASRLVQLASTFEPRGVEFVAIMSNHQDSHDDIVGYVADYRLDFPVARDEKNRIADLLHAERTPEVVVLDRKGHVGYRGRIDDQYLPGITRGEPTERDLANALTALLDGKEPATQVTDPVGCIIGRVRKPTRSSDITYCNQVARILQRNCVECHRDGEIGPFALTDYDEIVGWGEMMLEVIEQERMPPWHANPKYGEFKNARSMPQRDRQQLAEWVAAGYPYGDLKQLPAPAPTVTGWQLPGEPDGVWPMRDRPIEIPADGTVEYQYFVVDPHFEEDKWVQYAEVQPGNRAVVHHAIVFIRPPDGTGMRGVGWLTAYVPGQRSVGYRDGLARRVPAGSKFVFQMHYTPNGQAQSDLSQLGVIFADDADVTHEVATLIAINQEFEIPPHADHHIVTANVGHVPPQGMLLAAAPHMHLRGRSFRLFVEQEAGDGSAEHSRIALDVPRYDFNWQHNYEFAKPISLESVRDLAIEVGFDNSEVNPVNPAPDEFVTWGDQTWEEMAIAFFDVAMPRDASWEREQPSDVDEEPEDDRMRRAQQFVDHLFDDLDRNGDRVIALKEVPLVVRRFTFRRFDNNNDGQITPDEALQVGQRVAKR